MARQLITTKLSAPRVRRDLVPRPRLVQRLERGAEARLTLVSAPAGFGKSTLVAAWLADTSDGARSVAWLSLDAADNEPSVFWTYALTALQGAVPSVGSAALELLGSAPVPTELMLTRLVNELAATPGEVWLVLDDYHLVDHPEIREGMAFFLEHLPERAHVVLITRADPDLPLARWRVRGELVEVRAADLRFTAEETGTYLNATPGVDLGATDVAVLEERTEGWIAALQLAALSLQGREDVSGFVAGFAGDDRYVVDYLADEVLEHQSAAVREFLLQTAVLDRMTGLLCNAVTGREDGSDLLRRLERANLFLIALDDRREWYRYHHLFAEVLRARLLNQHPDQVPLLHVRASQWFADHDLTDEAITHALAARDFRRAGHLMEMALPAIRRDRQDTRMHGWLALLPDDVIRASPVLSVFYGSLLLVTGDLEGAEARLDHAHRALGAVAEGETPAWTDTEELHTLPATISVYRAALARARGDLTASAQHARHALTLAGPEDHLARGAAGGFLGLAAWSRGDVSTALETFSQAVNSLHAAGNVVDELTSTVVLADLWLVAGRPSTARRLYEGALQLPEARGVLVDRATADLHTGLSELAVEAGQLDSAREHLETAAALDDRPVTSTSRYRWFVARGLLARADGNAHEAVELLDQAEQLYRPGIFPDVRPIAALKARVWIAQGLLAEAAGWARERRVTTLDSASYLDEFDHLTLVRLLLAQHRAEAAKTTDAAGALLAGLHEAAESAGRAGSLFEIRLLQALALDAGGSRPEAIETLVQALALAPEPDSYVRLFLDEGAPMLSLLRDLTQQGLTHHLADRLLADADRETSLVAAGSRRAPVSADTLSERELQVLRLLDSELTGPEIARQLFVTHNTVRTHTKHIFTKLDVTSRRSAVRRARERGFL